MNTFRHQLRTPALRFLSYFLVSQLALPVFIIEPVIAEVIRDPNAEVRFSPRIYQNNNVPVIDIVTPDRIGVSHNQYQDFDVDQRGLVFNNSLLDGESRQAGTLTANPNLQGRAASTILNEITGASDSQLQGALEVFGDQANVIIANPNGITCNGCGFINTGRATLTTGTPRFIGDKLVLDVNDGAVRFEGEGASYRYLPESIDVFARYIDVNAEIFSKQELNIIAGRYDVDYSGLLNDADIQSVISKKAEGAGTPERVLAIDASVLGAMQSGRISLMSLEQGLGVKADGYMYARADDLFATSAGDLQVRNADALKNIKLQAEDTLTVHDDLIANTSIALSADNIETQQSTSLTSRELTFNGSENVDLKGEYRSLSTEINSDNAQLNDASVLAINEFDLNVQKGALNDSTIKSKANQIDAATLAITDSQLAGQSLKLTAQQAAINNSGFDIAELQFNGGDYQFTDTQILSQQLTLSLSGKLQTTAVSFLTQNSDLNSQSWTSDNSQWVYEKGNLQAQTVHLTNSTLYGKQLSLTAGDWLSENNRLLAESLSFNASNTATSNNDLWRAFAFNSDAPRENVGENDQTLALNAKQLTLNESRLLAQKTNIKSEQFTMAGGSSLSQQLTLDSGAISITEAGDDNTPANIRALQSFDIKADKANLNALVQTENLSLSAKEATLKGAISANTFSSNTDRLALEDLNVSSQNATLNGQQIRTNNSQLVSEQLTLTAKKNLNLNNTSLKSQTLSASAEVFTSDANTQLFADTLTLSGTTLNNDGKVIAAEQLKATATTLNNSGVLAAFDRADITATTLTNHNDAAATKATITANQLTLTSTQLNNQGDIGATDLYLNYHALTNASGAEIRAENITSTAMQPDGAAAALFNNQGKLIVNNALAWLKADGAKSNLQNTGEISAKRLHFTGLDEVSNGLAVKGNIPAQGGLLFAEESITIGDEIFNQFGGIKTQQLTIQRDAFTNHGNIKVDQLTAITHTLSNSGDIQADKSNITTTDFTNQNNAGFNAQQLNVTVQNFDNQGTILVNQGVISAKPGSAETSVFNNTGTLAQIDHENNDSSPAHGLKAELRINDINRVSNNGDITAEGELIIDRTGTVNNGQINSDARLAGSTLNMNAQNLNNEGIVRADQLTTNVDTLTNQRLLVAEQADIQVNQTLTNRGHIYQAKNDAGSFSLFDIAAAEFLNEKDGTIELGKGQLTLTDKANRQLTNRGLITQIKDDNTATLALVGAERIHNEGTLELTELLTLNNGYLNNQGKDSTLILNGLNANQLTSVKNDGTVKSTGNVDIQTDTLANSGLLFLKNNDLNIDANTLNNQGAIWSGQQVAINQNTANGTINNSGYLYGNSVAIGNSSHRQNTISNSGRDTGNNDDITQGGIRSGNGDLLLFTDIYNDQQGQLSSANKLTLDSQQDLTLKGLVEADNALILSANNLSVEAGSTVRSAGGDSDIKATNAITNNGSLLLAGNSELKSQSLNNLGLLQGEGLTLNITGLMNNQSSGNIRAQSLNTSSDTLTNNGNIFAENYLGIKSTRNVNNSGRLFSNGATIVELSGNFDNNSSGRLFGANINVQANTITNSLGGQISSTITDIILHGRSVIRNDGLIVSNGNFNLTGDFYIINNGTLHAESKQGGISTLKASVLNNGNAIDRVGVISTNGGLNLDARTLNNNSYSFGDVLEYKRVFGSNFREENRDKKNSLGKKFKRRNFYFTIDVEYGKYRQQQGSTIYAGGDINYLSNGIVANRSSSIKSNGFIDFSKASSFDNITTSFSGSIEKVEWSRTRIKSNANIGRYRGVINEYQGQNEKITSAITKSSGSYSWDNQWVKEMSSRILESNPTDNVDSIVGVSGIPLATVNAAKGVKLPANVKNTGVISAPVITGGDKLDEIEERSIDTTTATANNGSGGTFLNGVDENTLVLAAPEPSSTINLLAYFAPGLSFDALSAASVADGQTPDQLAAQQLLAAQLAQLSNSKRQGQSVIDNGQGEAFTNRSPSIFDLDADILSLIIADTEYELQPDYVFQRVGPDQKPDVTPAFFLDPYQEAQLLTQASIQQTGSAFFSPDWNTSAEQRQGLYDNAVTFLESNKGVVLGQALTRQQLASLEQPMIWYVSMNIGGTDQLVPTVYLPEATLEQITTPTAGTLIADSMDINTGNFKNTGDIHVKDNANINADVITNQRNVLRFGDDTNYGALAQNGGNLNAGNLNLTSRGDINNNGGSLNVNNNLVMDAQGDINLKALELSSRHQFGKNIDESTDYLLSQMNVGGNATLKAGGDINSQATQANIGGNALFDAENIHLLGVTERDYQERHKKKKGTFSSSKSTTKSEQLNFIGSDFDIGGDATFNARNNITMVGADIAADGNVGLKAGNDITLTAGISQDSYSKDKKGSGVATTSAQQKGHIKQSATGTSITSGGNLKIDSDGGDVQILASNLDAEKNLIFGDTKIKRDETGAPLLDDNGQYITEDGSSINNLTIGTVELTDKSWNKKQSGLKGPLKDLAAAATFALSATGVGQAALAAGLNPEFTVGESSETITESTTHQTSTLNAGDKLVVRTDGDTRIEGADVSANTAYLETRSTTITAVENTTTTTESHSTHTVAATKANLKKDEVTVAGVTETKHKETTTTTDTQLKKASLNVGTLVMNSEEDINILASDIDVEGDASVKANNIKVAGLRETTTTEHQEETQVTTTSVGVKNAYVDTAYATQAVTDAGAAVEAAKAALDDAKQRIKDGTLQANALEDYKANLAAATTQLGQATLALAQSGATAAGTTATGGFYMSGSAETTTTEKTSTSTEQRYIGSSFNVGGNATFDATNMLDIEGSDISVQEQLTLNGDTINITAGTEENTSESTETTRTAGMTVSTNNGMGGGVNASGSNTDSDSYSKAHVNSSIQAGSLNSTSDRLNIAGANIEIDTDIDITTNELSVVSLQDEARSSSKTEGYNASMNVGAEADLSPGSFGGNQNSSKSDSQWVNNQTTLIGGTSGEGKVTINAGTTHVKGGVITSATRNEDGSLTDNNNLTLITDELIVEDLQDKDHSESRGTNVSTSGYSGTGTTTVGLTSSGHKKEQTTLATLGGGNIQKRDGSEHDVSGINNDLNNSQEITKDMQTGGLNATVTVDHRLASEEGRQDIAENFVDTAEHGQDIARAVSTVSESDDLSLLNFGEVLDKNAKGTQLKNDLLRDPEHQHILVGLNSADPDLHAKALKDLGNLAQNKFGLELSDINLYDSNTTESTSLADSTLADVKGATVVDQTNQEYGNIFIDAGDGASKTDLVNTLGHEVIETQDLQGQGNGLTGGLFGDNNADTQEAIANAFGNQLADRINQASDGKLDSSGGDNFSDNLRNSDSVKLGTERADNVGGADVEYRQHTLVESRLLDRARDAINNDETLTRTEKNNRINELEAVACASINCAAGLPGDDQQLDAVLSLETQGDQLIADGANIHDLLNDLNISTPTSSNGRMGGRSETSFGYDGVDALEDAASEHLSQAANVINGTFEGGTEVAAGVILGPVIDAIDGDSNVTGELIDKGLNTISDATSGESSVGQNVLNSQSEATHQDENYLGDALLAGLELTGVSKLGKDGVEAVARISGRNGDTAVGAGRANVSQGETNDFYQQDPNTGEYYWPDNLGFKGEATENVIPEGTIIDRYGDSGGSFLSNSDSSFAERALGPGDGIREYHQYRVLKPLPVKEGEIAPAFGQPGGGTQMLPNFEERVNVQWLIENKYIEEVRE